MPQIHRFSFTSSPETLTALFRFCSATPLITPHNLHTSSSSSSSSSSHPFSHRSLKRSTDSSKRSGDLSTKPNLKRLTSRIVELTRRKQLRQVLEEVEIAKERYGELNTIVMNAVMEACVRCGDVDSAVRVFREMSRSCGVDDVTFGTLLKVIELILLGNCAHLFKLVQAMLLFKGVFFIRLLSPVVFRFKDICASAGDLRRANGLLARYSFVLHEGGSLIIVYNLLMKGYINVGSPNGAFDVHEEIRRQGLKPDRLTYNTLLSACVKSGKMDAAMQFLAEMKDEAQKANAHDLFPDAITYTTLLKGFGHAKDLPSVEKIALEMKSSHDLLIDRIAYTSMIDALLNCGSVKGALCIFGEILKKSGSNPDLRPKPHLYLSMMRAFASKGDYNIVKKLHSRMWLDTAGVIKMSAQVEADELLMEAAMNCSQVEVALQILSLVVSKWERIPCTTRGSMAAVRLEVLSGCTNSMLGPYLLPQVSLGNSIEDIMLPIEEARPLQSKLKLEKVVMRFYWDDVVPVIDDWGNCVGVAHREDCRELNATISSIMRSPFPCVTPSATIGQVIDLLLEKRYKIIIVVKPRNLFETGFTSCSRAVGIFSSKQLNNLTSFPSSSQKPFACRMLT
ncbi:hypothetical protein Syun_024937 [Stephania yunnanensis]|uniref:CBS domain-containing protein n=1 Tax=Stephania yunnanensis TaxID=152371 RepID=A0AAP0EW20_9MAGN